MWARHREASCELIVAGGDLVVWRVMVVVI